MVPESPIPNPVLACIYTVSSLLFAFIWTLHHYGAVAGLAWCTTWCSMVHHKRIGINSQYLIVRLAFIYFELRFKWGHRTYNGKPQRQGLEPWIACPPFYPWAIPLQLTICCGRPYYEKGHELKSGEHRMIFQAPGVPYADWQHLLRI